MSASARIELDADEGPACCDFASRCMGLESTMHDSGNAQQVCHRQAPTLRSFLTRLRLGMGTGFSHPSSPLQSLARWLLNLVRLHPSARFESRSRCKSGQLVRSGGRCCVVQTANPATPLSNMPSILDFNRCIFRGSILWRWWGQVKDRTHTFIRSGILDSFVPEICCAETPWR